MTRKDIPPDVSLFPRRAHQPLRTPDPGWLLETYSPSRAEDRARALGMDMAKYNSADYNLLHQNGVEFLVGKASQGDYRKDIKYNTHASGAEGAGMIPAAYHWNDPLSPDIAQADFFLESIEGSPAKFIWIDVEQEWADWNEWLLAVQGRGRITKFIPPARISESAFNIVRYIGQNCNLPLAIYTRVSFLNDYAAPMFTWVQRYPLVLAQYPYTLVKVHVSWDEMRANYPKIWDPILPVNSDRWHFWQFTGDKFYVPGCDTPVDLDFWNGDIDSLTAWAGGQTPPTPPPPAKEGLCFKVVQDGLNVRTGPGTNFTSIGKLAIGQVVQVRDVGGSGAWVEFEYQGMRAWANVQIGSDRNMEPA